MNNRRVHEAFSKAGVVLALLAFGALTAVAGSSARSAAVEPTPWGADWNADARVVRAETGSRFVFLCPAKGAIDRIWGTTVYTDDSSVCTAAVHRGLITAAEGGMVTIEHLPGKASYDGSTAHGVTSEDYGAWDGSFQVVGATQGGPGGTLIGGGTWLTNAAAFRGDNGDRYLYICPGGGTLGSVWGTNTYTDDSSVCSAAVQVGLIDITNGGRVTIEIRPGETSYKGFTANGVASKDYGTWSGSFVFPAAAHIPGSPTGGGTTTTPTGGGGAAAAPPTGTTTGSVTVNGVPFTGGTIPYNKTVDVTKGSVLLKTSTGSLKVTPANGATAAFVLVRGTENKKPIVELRLAKGDFSVCPKRKTRSASAGSPTVVRQLWGNGKGNFRTRGKYAAATVRGTYWLTSDRCDGTLTTVKRGVVQVTDLSKHKTVTVPAGRSYLATP